MRHCCFHTLSRCVRLAASGLMLLGLSTASAQAATYCADTTAGLLQALSAASASPSDDLVRVVQGDYVFTQSQQYSIQGGLRLRGGYSSCGPFVVPAPDPALTRLRGSSQAISLQLRLNSGDSDIRRLSFLGFALVTVDDAGGGNAVTATFEVANTRVENGAAGLFLDLDTTHIRAENNLFANNVGAAAGGDYGLRVQHNTAASAPVNIDLLFNTVLGQPLGLWLEGGGPLLTDPGSSDVGLHHNIFDAGVGQAILANNIALRSHDTLRRGSLSLQNGAAIIVTEYELVGDPLLSPEYVPLAGSPALNTGVDPVPGGAPGSDIDGGRRIIGSAPDRGAFESAISDISTLTVVNANNTGAGSLRQAIVDSNLTSNAETIEFAIPGGCPHTLVLASPLPAVTSPLTIDAFTQPGSVPNQDDLAYNAVHCVIISGAETHALRLEPEAGEVMTVRGLRLFGFTTAAVNIDGAGVVRIEGNQFGGVPAAEKFDTYAIRFTNAPGSVVGGGSDEQRNLIGRAAAAGIYLGAGTMRTINNNLIGFAADGYSASSNGIGIRIVDGFGDTISENAIGHSIAQGILAERPTLGKQLPQRTVSKGGPETYTQIRFNRLGYSPVPDPGLSHDAGNGTNGVRLVSGSQWQISGNTVAYNGTDGIVVLTPVQNARLESNVIHHNGQLGIDLSPDGVDPQSEDFGANGANGTQNYPLLDSADGDSVNGVLRGSLRSSPGATYTIQLYFTSTCDASGHGEGEFLLSPAQLQVTIPGASPFPFGDATVSFSTPITAVAGNDESATLSGKYITALASNGNGATSEFSACVPYVVTAVFSDGFENP